MVATMQRPNYGLAQSKALDLLNRAGLSAACESYSDCGRVLKVPVLFATFESNESERISGFL
jgi:hypothetical protein